MDPLRALRGARDPVAPRRAPTVPFGWREAAVGTAGFALGGLMLRTFGAKTPIRDTVTAAWTQSQGLSEHPAALLSAATAAARDLSVSLTREAWEEGGTALADVPRVLFFRMPGPRFSDSDIINIREFFDRRPSSRCLVVLMFNKDLRESRRYSRHDTCAYGQELSQEHYVWPRGTSTRKSRVPIECVFAFFDEGTLHPFHQDPNKRAVDAIAALIQGSGPRFGIMRRVL